MKRITKFFLAVFLLVLGLAPSASARLVAAGPINPGNGFPLYYVDSNGVALEIARTASGHRPYSFPRRSMPSAPPWFLTRRLPGTPFPNRSASARNASIGWRMPTLTGVPSTVGVIVFRAGLEAAFAGGDALNGDQMVFSRIQGAGQRSHRTPAPTWCTIRMGRRASM